MSSFLCNQKIRTYWRLRWLRMCDEKFTTSNGCRLNGIDSFCFQTTYKFLFLLAPYIYETTQRKSHSTPKIYEKLIEHFDSKKITYYVLAMYWKKNWTKFHEKKQNSIEWKKRKHKIKSTKKWWKMPKLIQNIYQNKREMLIHKIF